MSAPGRRRLSVTLPVAAFLAALWAFRAVRHYPWTLAAVVALALAVLVFTSLRAGDQIRDAWRARWRRDDRQP